MYEGSTPHDPEHGLYVSLFDGSRFCFDAPEQHPYNLATWRHHLQGINRFGGGSRCTVWTHLVNCSDYAHKLGMSVEVQRAMLFHDWEEVIFADRTSPVKKYLGISDIERKVSLAIRSNAHLKLTGAEWDGTMSAEMELVDAVMLRVEAEEHMPDNDWAKNLPQPVDTFMYQCPTRSPLSFHALEIRVLERCGVPCRG